MSLPRTFARRQVDDGRYCLSSRNSPVPTRTNAFTVLPPLSPQIPGPPSTPKPYRCRAPSLAKKENSAFVILTELGTSRSPSPPGGRVSPFRGRGFKPPASSRHASPSPDPKGTPKAARSRSKQAKIVKGVVGKSAPSSPSKRSNIPKPILRRSSLSPNRAKELIKTTANGNNFLQVNNLIRKETILKKPPPSPRKVGQKPKDDNHLNVPKTHTSILKTPKKSREMDSNNNNRVSGKVETKTVKNRNEMNKNNVKEEKENSALTRKKPVRDLNANVLKSPAKAARNDVRRPVISQKPPLPLEAKTKARPNLSPNPRKRSPLVTSNITSSSKPNSSINSRNSSRAKPPSKSSTSTVSSTKFEPAGDTKKPDGVSNTVSNNNSSSKSSSDTKNNKQNGNDAKISKTMNGTSLPATESVNDDCKGTSGVQRSAKKEVEMENSGMEPAKVEIVNEKKVKSDDWKGSPKSRGSSGKSRGVGESSVALMRTATASATAPAEPSILPQVTSMVNSADLSSKPAPLKRIIQVQKQTLVSGSSSESVRSSSSKDTIRAIARVKGTVLNSSSSKVASVSGKLKGGPDLEVLSANALMSQGNDANHAASRMAWDEPPPRATGELTDSTTTSVKPTGCLGNICKLLNCCQCCQSWQKRPKPPNAAEKPSLLQRLNCFRLCPSLNLSSKISSACGKLNCCRKLELSSCCKNTRLSNCCKKMKLSSCCQKLSCCKAPFSCCRRSSIDDASEISDEPKIKCANMKSCWRFTFCLNRACCQRVRQMCRCRNFNCCKPGGCCGRISPEEEAMRKKRNSRATFKKSRTSSVFSDIPKLDPTFVEYNSIMRASIPVLPVPVAWMCLILNLFLPGVGTLWSGLMCLCLGKPRFSVNDTPLARIGAFCINTMVALAQMFTVLFCLVGWGWGVWWGVIILRLAKKHKRIKMAEAGGTENRPTPVVLNQNHADAERGHPSVRA